MSWYKKVKYDCRNTTYRIEKQQNDWLGLIDTISLYTHLVTCPFCRLYKKQTKIIRQLLREIFNSSNSGTLDSAFKERLQRMIDERLY
jgi:hypothetical protein